MKHKYMTLSMVTPQADLDAYHAAKKEHMKLSDWQKFRKNFRGEYGPDFPSTTEWQSGDERTFKTLSEAIATLDAEGYELVAGLGATTLFFKQLTR